MISHLSFIRKFLMTLDSSNILYLLIRKMSNFVIDNKIKVKDKVDMIQSLTDIEIATKIVDEMKDSHEGIHETYYKKLNCNLRHIESHENVYSVIEKYLINTTKDNPYQTIEIINAFEIEKLNDKENFINYGNRKLLWHGSRITNFVGILSQGLRIAPPEAPVSGYLFGKGVYFADMAAKSACYCYPSNNVALILLCEVSLGNPRELNTTDHNAANLPAGCHSTKGNGKTIPSEEIDFEDGVKVPLGPPTKSSHDVRINIFLF
jgi:poly [ADP-ribose] polymerase